MLDRKNIIPQNKTKLLIYETFKKYNLKRKIKSGYILKVTTYLGNKKYSK